MLKISVKEDRVETQSGNSKRTGKAYSIRSQRAWVDLGKAFPVEVKLTLGDDQAAFPVGEYTLTPQCFQVNNFGELDIALRNMQPIKAAGVVR